MRIILVGNWSTFNPSVPFIRTPEQAIQAHQAVRGKLIVPSGWGTFDLGPFPWHEPIDSIVISANQAGIDYLTPKIAEVINPETMNGRYVWRKPFSKKTKGN